MLARWTSQLERRGQHTNSVGCADKRNYAGSYIEAGEYQSKDYSGKKNPKSRRLLDDHHHAHTIRLADNIK